MLPSVVSRLFILLFGTLYPAYNSYKAVRNKDPREYVKCMMYWIVFAIYSTVETFTDVFLSFWFPFYHELKILILLWLMSPTTRGSTYLYTKIVHPALTSREQEIDEAIALAKQQGYVTVMKLGSKGVHYASSVIMQTALKGLQLPPNALSLPTRSNSESSSTVVGPSGGEARARDGVTARAHVHTEPDVPDSRDATDDWMLGPSSLATRRAHCSEMFSDDDEDIRILITKPAEMDDDDDETMLMKPRPQKTRRGTKATKKPRARSTRAHAYSAKDE